MFKVDLDFSRDCTCRHGTFARVRGYEKGMSRSGDTSDVVWAGVVNWKERGGGLGTGRVTV